MDVTKFEMQMFMNFSHDKIRDRYLSQKNLDIGYDDMQEFQNFDTVMRQSMPAGFPKPEEIHSDDSFGEI